MCFCTPKKRPNEHALRLKYQGTELCGHPYDASQRLMRLFRMAVEQQNIQEAAAPAEWPDREYFCDELPKAVKGYAGPVEKFLNWARANSLWILGFGTGCGAIELRPLMTARFDMYRYGIAPRPTPRQSSVFIIGGYASVKTMKRIVRSYEQMQNPKFVIGLGSCTINGGMYWDSYNTINRLDHYIPVDVYVTGCMPRPEALLAGFNTLKELIKAGKAEGANTYANNFAWYKANQKQIIKDWNMPEYNW